MVPGAEGVSGAVFQAWAATLFSRIWAAAALDDSNRHAAKILGGTAKAIEVKIPKGLTRGKKIRLAGKGGISPNGGPAGNLYIKSNPISSNGYTIEGNDVLLSKSIKLTQALIGDTIEILTPAGTSINLKVPAGTNSKSKMRIPNHGIPQMKGNGCGDLFVVINITLPKKLTAQQQKLVQQLKETGL